MNPTVLQLGSALLYGTAGRCIFLMLLNRFLILMPDSRTKTPCNVAALAPSRQPIVPLVPACAFPRALAYSHAQATRIVARKRSHN